MKSLIFAGALALALASLAQPACAQTQTGKPIVQGTATAPISTAAAGNVLLQAGFAGVSINVTNWNLYAAGTTNDKFFSATTGSGCASGAADLTGAYNLKDQGGLVVGNGLGPVLIVPQGKDLCFNNSAAIQVSGSYSWAYN